MEKKDLIFPTIKLASTNIEQCQVDLEIAMGCMDGMKNDIQKVGDSTLNVVQGALKAKNNGLEKEGRGGGYFLNLLKCMLEHICVLIVRFIV
jgi:hypothetical protein